MTGSEQIDGLQAKVADRTNRWKPPGTKQTSRSRRGRPAPRPRSGPPRRIPGRRIVTRSGSGLSEEPVPGAQARRRPQWPRSAAARPRPRPAAAPPAQRRRAPAAPPAAPLRADRHRRMRGLVRIHPDHHCRHEPPFLLVPGEDRSGILGCGGAYGRGKAGYQSRNRQVVISER
jgi:hypothetical protein